LLFGDTTMTKRALILTLLFLPLAAGYGTQARANADFVIRHVNVVTMVREEVLADRAVVVRNGRIAAIVPDGLLERTAAKQQIDAAGGYVIPGLSDMHVHLGLKLPTDGDPTYEGMASDLSLYLPNGVTTVRNMRGTPGDLMLRDALRSGALLGPDLILAGPSLHATLPVSFGPKIETAEQAEREVRAQANAGYDLIKVHGNLPPPAFDAIIRTAHALRIQVAGHIQTDKDAAKNAQLGSIEHAEEIAKLLGPKADFSAAPDVLDAIVKSGVYVVPTLVVFDSIAKYLDDNTLATLYAAPATTYVSAYWRRNMAADKNYFRRVFGDKYRDRINHFVGQSARLRLLTRQLHDAGVPLLLGTDAVGLVAPGFSVHEELELLVSAGLTPYEALKAATVNPARWAGAQGRRGIIATGAEANLVLLAANPLERISASQNVRGVFIHNKWQTRAQLDEPLAKRALETH
jgi:imidazolonepropionase-like amidohydrolase